VFFIETNFQTYHGVGECFGPDYKIMNIYQFNKSSIQVSRLFGGVSVSPEKLQEILRCVVIPFPLQSANICTLAACVNNYEMMILKSAYEYIDSGAMELRNDAVNCVRTYYEKTSHPKYGMGYKAPESDDNIESLGRALTGLSYDCFVSWEALRAAFPEVVKNWGNAESMNLKVLSQLANHVTGAIVAMWQIIAIVSFENTTGQYSHVFVYDSSVTYSNEPEVYTHLWGNVSNIIVSTIHDLELADLCCLKNRIVRVPFAKNYKILKKVLDFARKCQKNRVDIQKVSMKTIPLENPMIHFAYMPGDDYHLDTYSKLSHVEKPDVTHEKDLSRMVRECAYAKHACTSPQSIVGVNAPRVKLSLARSPSALSMGVSQNAAKNVAWRQLTSNRTQSIATPIASSSMSEMHFAAMHATSLLVPVQVTNVAQTMGRPTLSNFGLPDITCTQLVRKHDRSTARNSADASHVKIVATSSLRKGDVRIVDLVKETIKISTCDIGTQTGEELGNITLVIEASKDDDARKLLELFQREIAEKNSKHGMEMCVDFCFNNQSSLIRKLTMEKEIAYLIEMMLHRFVEVGQERFVDSTGILDVDNLSQQEIIQKCEKAKIGTGFVLPSRVRGLYLSEACTLANIRPENIHFLAAFDTEKSNLEYERSQHPACYPAFRNLLQCAAQKIFLDTQQNSHVMPFTMEGARVNLEIPHFEAGMDVEVNTETTPSSDPSPRKRCKKLISHTNDDAQASSFGKERSRKGSKKSSQ
jgi:hypothetical protein